MFLKTTTTHYISKDAGHQVTEKVTRLFGFVIKRSRHTLIYQKEVQCANCGDTVRMISKGEFCPNCFC